MSDLTTKATEIRAGLVDGRTLSGEVCMGMQVAAYMADSRHGAEFGNQFATHWSTIPGQENPERLFRESHVLALIEQQEAELAAARAERNGAHRAGMRLGAQRNAAEAECDSWRRVCERLETEKQALKSERDELLCEKERLEREARAGDFIIKDLTGTIKRLTAERNNSDAVNYTAERRAREAMAGLSNAESTNASQSERIAVLEAALAAEREACAKVAEGLRGQRGNSPEHLVGRRIAAAIRARSALAPLGEG